MLAPVPIYGTIDAGRNLYLKLLDTTNQSGFRRYLIFSALYYALDENGELVALLCTHVDDLLFASRGVGTAMIQKVFDTFKIGKIESGAFRFCGREELRPIRGRQHPCERT